MQAVVLIFIILVLTFSLVVFFGAPYLPTLSKQKKLALDLLNLKPGQTLLELGCGDGRVMRAAAQRGWRVEGYELNPILVLVAKLTTWRYRKLVKVHWGDYWRQTLPKADGIFVFLLDKYMLRLDTKIIQEQQGHHLKLVSFAFAIPGKNATKTSGGLFFYTYK